MGPGEAGFLHGVLRKSNSCHAEPAGDFHEGGLRQNVEHVLNGLQLQGQDQDENAVAGDPVVGFVAHPDEAAHDLRTVQGRDG